MTEIASVSHTDLEERRKKLRWQRRMKILQAIWRTLAVSGLAGGLLWIAVQPIWVLKTPQDIVISGNQLLSDEAIESLLVMNYPQSLWRIEPSRIVRALKQQPTIKQATVSRRLFPPGLIIQVKERVPVAIAQSTRSVAENAQTDREQQDNEANHKKVSLGLLDSNGVWMPIDKYISLNPTVKSLRLKVIGSPEQYLPYWSQLYQAISQSTVKVLEVDCQDATNLILKTELGNVHLGVPTAQLSEKINVMEQLRHLPTQINPSQIEYIDLKNPEAPLVQMNQKKQQINSQIP